MKKINKIILYKINIPNKSCNNNLNNFNHKNKNNSLKTINNLINIIMIS